ncbi:transcriptional regulator [Bacillus sp. AFS077874]|uniref:helix-turn-helix transcriptional regulator n=1 Tax=unclassified Bacillus (in: firmicutes) TaxID=185979 RepID=UPI000BEDD0AE|nr:MULTISPECIES: YafY family protein [unclassified Bacillus (in: firmicutes)]PEC51141.1 transcriptional regulator [Bacillus sp. AFS096315]PFM81308.1 transcriptional regulator [Bacillus sp. AFS077874]
MKKSERINQILRFINQKQHFTLQDLMQEFQISKRTALRDVASLEEIGAPIYAEYGRYGGYRLLNQMKLPPIYFNNQEILALYFAMQALQSFSNLPFQVSYRTIHEKFINVLSEWQKKEIELMQNRVSFQHTVQIKESIHLEILLMAAVQNIVLKITYQNSFRTIHPIAIYVMKGYWYCQAYDIDKTAYRVFRCDRITSAEITTIQPLEELKEITKQNSHSLWKPSENAIQFKWLINQAGIELFQQEHYPSMELIYELENSYIIGTYEPNELGFINKYLARLGKTVKIIEPTNLKESLRQYYRDILENI